MTNFLRQYSETFQSLGNIHTDNRITAITIHARFSSTIAPYCCSDKVSNKIWRLYGCRQESASTSQRSKSIRIELYGFSTLTYEEQLILLSVVYPPSKGNPVAELRLFVEVYVSL